jgi:hypothetical protein
MKIRPVGAQLFHAGGRADRQDEADVAFRNFAKAPQKINKFRTVPTFFSERID